MRKAVIDIGTNSTRLMVADCEQGSIEPVSVELAITRIGENVNQTKRISQLPLARTAKAVAEFAQKAKALGAEQIKMTATSAVRDAQNKAEVTQALQEAAGTALEILSGAVEAKMSYDGAAADFGHLGHVAVLDIGGGSTELVYPAKEGLSCKSVNIGAVRLLENPQLSVETLLQGLLVEKLPKEFALVAVGGTATSLAAMALQMAVYDRKKVHGYKMPKEIVDQWAKKLMAMPLERRLEIPGLMAKRADVIPYGAAILNQAMALLAAEEVIVSDKDLLYGLLMS